MIRTFLDRALSDNEHSNLALRADAQKLVNILPELRVQSHNIANSIMAGWHGRRRAGMGENFWQFRPLENGENAHNIDWRRSARDQNFYIRENEWEVAHRIFFVIDLSASMAFQSSLALASKRSQAIIIFLSLAEALLRGGERVGLLHHHHSPSKIVTGKAGLERLIEDLIEKDDARTNSNEPIKDDPAHSLWGNGIRQGDGVIVLSDFLNDDPAMDLDLSALFAQSHHGQAYQYLINRGISVHAIHMIDPVETMFPFTNRTEFQDPENGRNILIGKTKTMAERYRKLFQDYQQIIADFFHQRQQNYCAHLTDQSCAEIILAVHNALSQKQRQSMA